MYSFDLGSPIGKNRIMSGRGFVLSSLHLELLVKYKTFEMLHHAATNICFHSN